jgi:hypothetical protein
VAHNGVMLMSDLIKTRPAVMELQDVDGGECRQTRHAALSSTQCKGRPVTDTLREDAIAFLRAY